MKASLTLVLLLAACSGPKREERTEDELRAARARAVEAALETRRDTIDTMVKRAEREMEDDQRVLDLLIIHGGRDYGAFGAGFLVGWGEAQGELTRPDFDLVTGVSSCALLAPFAMIGSEKRIRQVYELHKNPDADWVKKAGLFFFWPSREATFDPSGLIEQIREEMDLDLAKEVARQRSEHKQLLIGSANADHGFLRVFRLGRVAQDASKSGDATRLHRIVTASLSLPVVFPPVEIDGDLYFDGATAQQMFLGLDVEEWAEVIRAWRQQHPETSFPKVRLWVIINGKLAAESVQVKRRWITLGLRSLVVMLDAGRSIVLRRYPNLMRLMRSAGGIEAEFRYVQIPEEWKDPADPTVLFDETRMRQLAELGYKMGKDPASWRDEVPSSRWPAKVPEKDAQ